VDFGVLRLGSGDRDGAVTMFFGGSLKSPSPRGLLAQGGRRRRGMATDPIFGPRPTLLSQKVDTVPRFKRHTLHQTSHGVLHYEV
jgi:hypothetical protein